jgi:SAM-dependent methyltransferase
MSINADRVVNRSFRWTIRQPSEPHLGTAEVCDLLHRVADRLEPLGPAFVEEVVLSREDDQLVVTIDFDRTKMKLEPGWLSPGIGASYDGPTPVVGPDKQFMIALADELGAETIVDLGCGPGTLARELAIDSRRIIGVDPSPDMLGFARQQPGSERVRWVDGDATDIGTPGADLVVTTGNVVMEILDSEWDVALRAIHAALRPGGHFAFGSRNWGAREWERWGEMYRTHSVIEGDGRVYAIWRSPFGDNGGTLEAQDEYRYRTLAELTESLTEARFTVERMYGDWDRSALSKTSPNIVIIARRDAPSGRSR